MSERLTDAGVEAWATDMTDECAAATALAREVQASRPLIAAARALAAASEAEMIRLSDLAHPNGDFRCPSDPCPYCTAVEEFETALMDYENGMT